MNKLAILIIILSISTVASAHPIPYYRHSSTVREGELTGVARLRFAQGQYLRNFGEYLNLRETARSRYLKNKTLAVKEYWERKDIWKAHLDANRKTWFDRETQRLDNAEKRYALKQREQKLIDEGMLPPKKKPGFYYNGKRYDSYYEFRDTLEWHEMIAERDARELARAAEKKAIKERQREATRRLAKWDRMSYAEKQKYIAHQNYLKMMEEHKKEVFDPQEKLAEKFYQTRPYLIPQAGKEGLPPLPKSLQGELYKYKQILEMHKK